MNHRSKSLCMFLFLLVGVFFISPHTHAAGPADAKVAWLTEQIADYLQGVTGETFGQSFRDMTANLLNAEFSEKAPWYQAMDKAYQRCMAAEQEPASGELRDMCEVNTQVAIQEALKVLSGSPGLPPHLVSVFSVALGETPEGEVEPAGPARAPAPSILILDPQTSEQERYYQDGTERREVSPSQ
ncbi:MAG: hypothetical protein JSV01_02585 [Desulfobacterales bacterium]|nr:MAG: hypothetical protein JSV01_02585 [Desulfobacterales bacterium]UCG79714.1 MAG: hypothetical protein JSV60_06940 [Desulfobacterales bacterium]